MKVILVFIEAITSPFSLLMRHTNNSNNKLAKWANSIVVFFLAALIVLGLVLYYYFDFIFKR